MSQANEETNSPEPQKPKRTLAEGLTFSIATFILAGIVGLIAYNWLTQKNQPPIVSVKAKPEFREVQGQFYIPFEVTNTGGDTAESVQVIAQLRTKGQVQEAGEQQIDFLSSGETEEGAFIFNRDPRQGELSLRVASYKLP